MKNCFLSNSFTHKLFPRLLSVLCLLILLFMTACAGKAQKDSLAKIKNLEFTVLSEDAIPEEMKKVIQEKNPNPFKITFSTSESAMASRKPVALASRSTTSTSRKMPFTSIPRSLARLPTTKHRSVTPPPILTLSSKPSISMNRLYSNKSFILETCALRRTLKQAPNNSQRHLVLVL